MKRCVFCGRRLWPLPWARIGWVIQEDGRWTPWHPACFRAATGGVTWLTLTEIQRILDEAQQ
jgi:hypothetical protein